MLLGARESERTMSDSFRLVICVDVDANDLADAYGKVYEAMAKLPEGMDWESSDEWFDDSGDSTGDPDELQAARMKYLQCPAMQRMGPDSIQCSLSKEHEGPHKPPACASWEDHKWTESNR